MGLAWAAVAHGNKRSNGGVGVIAHNHMRLHL